MNTATHLGREQTVTVGGKVYQLGRWDRSVWWDFLEWARSQLPDPLDGATKVIERLAEQQAAIEAQLANTKLDKDERSRLSKKANLLAQLCDRTLSAALDKRSTYLSVNSPEVQSLVKSMEGACYLFMLLLRKGSMTDATEDDALDLLKGCDPDTLARIFQTAMGEPPPADAKNG